MDHYDTVDVRKIPTSSRHKILVNKILDLGVNQGLLLKVDHDPKPLSYLLKEEHKLDFEWKYLEKGPSVWEVLIVRLSGYDQMALKDIVRNDTAKMLYLSKIDPILGNCQDTTLSEFAAANALSSQQLFNDIQCIHAQDGPHFEYWEPDLFSKFIEQNYQKFDAQLMNEIDNTFKKVLEHHADELENLSPLSNTYMKLKSEVITFFNKEKSILGNWQNEQNKGENIFDESHSNFYEILKQIKVLSGGFQPPASACPMTKYLYDLLEGLYESILCHIFIEKRYFELVVA